MKTRTTPRPGKCGRIAVLLALSLVLLLNTSQAMTLCVRGHGDVALELLVEDHCTCEMGTPDADSGGATVGVASRGSNDSGWPCLDIPISTSSCDRRMSLAADSHAPCLPGSSDPEPATMDPPCAVVRDFGVFPALRAPLETILLQV